MRPHVKRVLGSFGGAWCLHADPLDTGISSLVVELVAHLPMLQPVAKGLEEKAPKKPASKATEKKGKTVEVAK
ncbi:hypothetical protein Gohar_000116 [Gossypium harknessii]|uniref:Uncharacterized protein n=1 Tax=Gossypium harknessii TaxID=34285 RepID=A0A7J9ICY9_9ROSI|nr:hypothetical protein [Gossypium harknessii]